MKLYLARHGAATGHSDDDLRPLSPHGQAEVRSVADQIGVGTLHVARILHSGKLRAMETAELLRPCVAGEIEPEAAPGFYPEDSVDAAASMLSSSQEDLLIVGHQPFMSRLVARLVTGSVDREVVCFDTATVVALERTRFGRWGIDWVMKPRGG